jgi:hypothetical protein
MPAFSRLSGVAAPVVVSSVLSLHGLLGLVVVVLLITGAGPPV